MPTKEFNGVFVLCSCLKDQAMFKRKRKVLNSGSGYEKIADTDDEQEEEQYEPDSPDNVSEESPIVPATPENVPKYV